MFRQYTTASARVRLPSIRYDNWLSRWRVPFSYYPRRGSLSIGLVRRVLPIPRGRIVAERFPWQSVPYWAVASTKRGDKGQRETCRIRGVRGVRTSKSVLPRSLVVDEGTGAVGNRGQCVILLGTSSARGEDGSSR